MHKHFFIFYWNCLIFASVALYVFFFCYFIQVLLTTLHLSPLETTWPLNSVSVPDESPIKPGVDLERITESLNKLISMNVFLILREQAGAMEEHKNWFAIAKERTWRLRAKLFLMYKFWTHHVFYFHQCSDHCSSRIISSTGILFISTSLIMECALPTMILLTSRMSWAFRFLGLEYYM